MKIEITMTVDDELADDQDSTGLTEEAFGDLFDALSAFGYDIDIKGAG